MYLGVVFMATYTIAELINHTPLPVLKHVHHSATLKNKFYEAVRKKRIIYQSIISFIHQSTLSWRTDKDVRNGTNFISLSWHRHRHTSCGSGDFFCDYIILLEQNIGANT